MKTHTAEPPVIYISVIKEHLTARNVLKTKGFSVNVPGKDLAEKIRCSGKVSGNKADKSKMFKTFYGETKIPMIEECKINYSCVVIKELDLNSCWMVLAEIKEIYADKGCFADAGNFPDPLKIKPLLASIDGNFWTIGDEKI